MTNSARVYNALTGSELKAVIIAEVERSLDRAGIGSVAVTYPLASWAWTLTILQQDSTGEIKSDTPERVITAGHPEAIAAEPPPADIDKLSQEELDALTTPSEKMTKALRGGSKRFKHNPPSPTEVRESEGLAVPEG